MKPTLLDTYWMWIIALTGMLLMVTVIYFEGVINDRWTPPKAKAKPVATQSKPAKSVSTQPPKTQTPSLLTQRDEYLKEVLSDPDNFLYDEEKPTPAQLIVDGKTVKFIVGL